MPQPVILPPILTKANWDSEKGIIAKMKGETGIGEAMKQVKSAYDAVAWEKLDAKMACQNTKDLTVVAKAWAAAEGEWPKINKLREKVKELTDLAEATEKKYKKSSTIPASSTQHVGRIATAADHFWMTLKQNSPYYQEALKGFDDMRDNVVKLQALAAAKLKGYVTSITKDASQVLSTGTVEAYIGNATTGFHQGIRGLGASLKVQPNPDLQQFNTQEWNKYTLDGFKPKADGEVKAKVAQVLTSLKRLNGMLA